MSRAKTSPITSTNNYKIPPPDCILSSPDLHIGSVEKCTLRLWVYEEKQMIERPVTYVPGLYKIYDEILVNVALHAKESEKKILNVTIDAGSSRITIRGSGVGISIDQWVERAKLTNIFSTEFVVEIADGTSNKRFKQIFSSNMEVKHEAVPSGCEEDENWTEITFKPDLKIFKMDKLDNDIVALMTKRVVDMAGCLGKPVNVEVNGQPFLFDSFSEYCKLYMNSQAAFTSKPLQRFEEYVDERWQIVITGSNVGYFQQVSFVNGVATIRGGTHVNYLANKIARYLVSVINDKNKTSKGIDVKRSDVKDHLWVFVNALIDNPTFDCQTNQRLTLRAESFGSSWDFPQQFLDKVAKSDVARSIEEFKLQQAANKKNHVNLHIPPEKPGKCTLILTQGGVGMRLAIGGRSIAGREHYGVFSLSRELPNVKERSNKWIMQNADLTKLKEILGLQTDVKYDDAKSLKYDHVMIMTHQGLDGSYMKGSLISLFHKFCPALLKTSFLQEFKIPIVKAKHRDGKRIESFDTIPQYVTWKKDLDTEAKNWTIQYYERLETSYAEMKEYFKHIDECKRDFVWENDEDSEAEELAFSKKKIEARKSWLKNFKRGTFLDPREKKITYRDFVNKELVYYFIRENERSIPSIIDGMTPGQRAVLVYLFKRKSVDEMLVPELSCYASTCSDYRHGETSLASTIIGMAQDYVGSNNINLLLPTNGRFGTRLEGGKDHGDPWRLHTELSPMARLLFPKDDDIFLTYLNEVGQSDEVGQSVVQNWFVPIIPMVLVNGSEGTGTEWSSSVPNYNPLVVIENTKRLLEGGEPKMVAMHPWYKGFNGSIEKMTTEDTGVSYTTSGNIVEVDKRTLRITELPIGRWTQDYDEILESFSAEADNNKGSEDPLVQKFCNKSYGEYVLFSVCMSEEKLSALRKQGLLKKELKLTTCIGTSNMHLFDSKGVIKKYQTPEEILQEFVQARLDIYTMRRDFVLDKLKKDKLKCENKCKFVDCVRNGSIILSHREMADIFLELKEKGFDPLSEKESISQVAVAGLTNEDKESVENSSGYDYLLSLNIRTCDLEEMQAERAKLEKLVKNLEQDTVTSKWLRDLVALEAELTEEDEYGEIIEVAPGKSQVDGEMAAAACNFSYSSDLEAEQFPLAGTKRRRGPVSKQSPENKIRKLSKKSGSDLARINSDDEEEDASDESSDSEMEKSDDHVYADSCYVEEEVYYSSDESDDDSDDY